MTVREWASVPDNPIQRDTVARAKRARHLNVFEPIHADVNMAVLPSGERFKLDGHTRVHKWVAGDVPNAPTHVNVRVWQARDEEAVRSLYERFDNRAAVETSVDQLSGAVKAAGIDFKSPLLLSNRFANPVKVLWAECKGEQHQGGGALSASDLAEVISFFKPELELLDSIEPTKNRFSGPMILAALACFLIDGEAAIPFWRDYQRNAGSKIENTMDAVQALSDARANEKAKGVVADYILLRKGVAAYLAYRNGQTYTGGVKGLAIDNVRQLLRRAFAKKRQLAL